jgi:hypothetical protein
MSFFIKVIPIKMIKGTVDLAKSIAFTLIYHHIPFMLEKVDYQWEFAVHEKDKEYFEFIISQLEKK